MAGDDDVIDSAVVRIGPDLSGFRTQLEKDLVKAVKGVQAKISVVADGTGLRASVKEAVAKQQALRGQPVYKVKVVADGTGLRNDVRRVVKEQMALGNQPVYKVKVVADNKGLKGTVADAATVQGAQRTEDDVSRVHDAGLAGRLRAEQTAARERVRIADRAAREQSRTEAREAARRKKILRTSPQLIDYGGRGIRPMNLLYGIVTAMTPALFAMGASAAQASTSIAALGSAGIGAALGLSAVGIAFQGIGDALSLRQTVLDQEATGAANAVRTADDLAQAKRNLADAQRDEAQAARDVHKARREAVRDLEDLRQAVIDLDNQYKSDQISVAEAREAALATDRNYFATALDRARAWQDVRDAETRLSETALQRKQKKQDLATSLKQGIEGSDKVRDAQERARDAADRTKDARASLRQSGGIDKVSSAAARLKKKIDEMAPAAQEMYYWFEKNEGLFKRLQRQIAQDTLPGFNTFLQAITAAPKGGKSTLQLAAQYAGELGAIIGKYVGKLGEWSQSPLFRESMARIQETNAKAFDNLGQALLNLADPLLRIIDKAAPGFESLSDVLLELSERFADWIKELDESGKLTQWFKDSRTELGKWYDIATNIGTLLKNLFAGALPGGQSLVTNFRDFTQTLADWSNSPEGQKSIKDFFDRIKNLPYAQIIDFFKNGVLFFAAFRTLKFLKSLNPFFAGIASFAAANPAAFATAMSGIATAIGKTMAFLANDPKTAALLLGILAATKFTKAIGFDIKLPVVDRLRNTLTSRFKVLDKFVGGGATTGTMNVNAGVVNVYGKAIGGGAPGGKPGTAAAGGGLLLGTGVTIAAIIAAVFADQGFQRARRGEGFGQPVQRFVENPGLGTAAGTLQFASPVGIAAYALGQAATKKFFGHTIPQWIGAGLRVQFPFLADIARNSPRGKAVLAGRQESNAFTRLTKDLSMTGGFDNATAQASLRAYITNRKASIAAYVAWVKSEQGPVAAAEAQRIEDEKSTTALANLAAQYGYTAEEAEKFATKAYATGEETRIATGWVKGYNDQLGVLSERLDAVTGTKQIVLTLDGEEKVFASLESAAAYQQLIRQGKAPTQAALQRQKTIFQKNMAAGGTVPGYSPHDKADNIPAWLTANEYVQPVAAVKHYGTDFMEAVRTRRFPKYAEGGGVNQWPFPVKMPDAAAAVSEFVGVPGTDMEYRGRIPRGLGAVAGLGERMMQAVLATRKMFPWAYVTSGFRPGSITTSGNRSYHGFRRATDWPASMELFNFFVKQWGNIAREIIYSPAGQRQIWNGRPHMYTGDVRATHWNHVHLALADGGRVRKYDTGGVLPPGFSQVYNGTGRNETVRTERQERALAAPGLTRLDKRDLVLLAQYMAQATGTPAITMDGRRVAETTNRYNYLPSGV